MSHAGAVQKLSQCGNGLDRNLFGDRGLDVLRNAAIDRPPAGWSQSLKDFSLVGISMTYRRDAWPAAALPERRSCKIGAGEVWLNGFINCSPIVR
jgi:hypothetical protein